ncbi:PREDICTED: uncharacterized protein LOC101305287 [Fragaria vesca subsp. vesca]|uniref:uncharacterized protein LOC101305287 n=1 Tax=Fragaria vesca subsp. vesca TaxID=101020 RepID=UPI0002C33762|nr:PREDICTED: uncharacterized protein LOC101305287 [Fragaria vesca subsp. vesca]
MAAEISSIDQPLTPPPPPATVKRGSNHPVHDTLAIAANLANLLPTGTVLAFQTLTPSFSNNGCCQQLSNKFLTSSVIIICAVFCFLSSFTDSFIDNDNGGKLYYGIATFKGMYIFNNNDMEEDMNKYLKKYRIKFIDFVHAFISLLVFLIFALTNSNVQSCFFSGVGINISELAMKLPLGAGVLSTFLFTIFPTTRRGIGYADIISTQRTVNDM